MNIHEQRVNQRQAKWLDVDYFGDAVMDTKDEKLSPLEWERKLRDEDRAIHAGRRRRRSEEVVIEDHQPQHTQTRFGAFSGAGTEAEEQPSSIVSNKKKINLPWSKPEKT